MDVERAFRVRFGLKKEQDMVGLIEAAVNVAALIDPEKLKKHRSRIMKLLFDEDPGNAARSLFSDDELLKVTSPPANHTSHSTETIKKLGFKKSVEQELSQVAAAPPLMVGGQDKSMEPTKKKSMEPTKKMLGRKNPKEEEDQEAEKKAAKKRKIDFPEPKKPCDSRSKAKLSDSHVRQRTATFQNELKAQHSKPKPNSKS